MSRRCLVTGGAGFIGSNLVHKLCDKGWKVDVIDDLSSGHVKFLRGVNVLFLEGDYGDDGILEPLIKSSKYDVVFHMGAIPRVSYSVEEPLLTNEANVTQTLKLMQMCRGNVGRFIFSSSSSVNGDAKRFPTGVSEKKSPKSPYALQKSAIEDYCRLWSELYDLDTVVLRYFNVFGPNQYGDSPYSTVISAWCNNVTTGLRIRLDGSGEQARDFCYVDNVVSANMLAAASDKRFEGDVFNVACGDVHSVNDVLDAFRARVGNVVVQRAPERAGDVFKTHADISKTRRVLGYKPLVDFDEGLQRTFDWWGL